MKPQTLDRTDHEAPAARVPRLDPWHEGIHPHDGVPCLHGKVFDHPYFEDGTWVYTSRLTYTRLQSTAILATTYNRIYVLGSHIDPCPRCPK